VFLVSIYIQLKSVRNCNTSHYSQSEPPIPQDTWLHVHNMYIFLFLVFLVVILACHKWPMTSASTSPLLDVLSLFNSVLHFPWCMHLLFMHVLFLNVRPAFSLLLCSFFLFQHMGDFNYPRLADFGAAISGANKFLCQEVLEELDVNVLTLRLLFFPFIFLTHFIFHVSSYSNSAYFSLSHCHIVLVRLIAHKREVCPHVRTLDIFRYYIELECHLEQQ
jgi:hypothetical protein